MLLLPLLLLAAAGIPPLSLSLLCAAYRVPLYGCSRGPYLMLQCTILVSALYKLPHGSPVPDQGCNEKNHHQ